MIRNPNVRTKIARAMLIALVPLTICVQVALAHASPIVQTFRNGITLTSFSGTFEVIWPLQVTSLNAVIELRDLALPDPVAAPLLRVTGGDAVESPYTCPTVGAASTCSRIHLSGIPELTPGRYAMYWRVTHLDGFVEQRVARFTIDPLWIAPTPTPSIAPSPTATPSPTPTPRPSRTPAASPSPTSSPSGSPSATPSMTEPSPSPMPSASPDQQTPGGDVSGAALAGIVGLIALCVAIFAARGRR